MKDLIPKDVAGCIDHTLLKADAAKKDIIKLCQEAKKYKFASVCVNPHYVPLAKKSLGKSGVKVCTVIGFPLGATPKEVKAYEAKKAVRDGADEVDMVLNVSAMKSKEFKVVEEDINAVVKAVPKRVYVKVILEICYLTDTEIVKASKLAMKSGADFVKTSTGFGSGGATAKAVKLMKKTVGSKLEVKASGGIRDFPTAKTMIENGATRLGVSSSIAIVTGSKGKSAY